MPVNVPPLNFGRTFQHPGLMAALARGQAPRQPAFQMGNTGGLDLSPLIALALQERMRQPELDLRERQLQADIEHRDRMANIEQMLAEGTISNQEAQRRLQEQQQQFQERMLDIEMSQGEQARLTALSEGTRRRFDAEAGLKKAQVMRRLNEAQTEGAKTALSGIDLIGDVGAQLEEGNPAEALSMLEDGRNILQEGLNEALSGDQASLDTFLDVYGDTLSSLKRDVAARIRSGEGDTQSLVGLRGQVDSLLTAVNQLSDVSGFPASPAATLEEASQSSSLKFEKALQDELNAKYGNIRAGQPIDQTISATGDLSGIGIPGLGESADTVFTLPAGPIGEILGGGAARPEERKSNLRAVQREHDDILASLEEDAQKEARQATETRLAQEIAAQNEEEQRMIDQMRAENKTTREIADAIRMKRIKKSMLEGLARTMLSKPPGGF